MKVEDNIDDELPLPLIKKVKVEHLQEPIKIFPLKVRTELTYVSSQEWKTIEEYSDEKLS